MGKVFIEGLGNVEIKGDVPDEEETRIILEAMGEGEGDITVQQPTPQPPQQAPQPAPQQTFQTLSPAPSGFSYDKNPLTAKPQVTEPPISQAGLIQYVKEAAPATAGAYIGGTIGSAAGPWGTVAGASIGGVIGEGIGQATGVAPESDLNLVLAAGGPVVGAGVGKVFQLGRRAIGTVITKAPFSRAAFSRMMAQKTAEEFEGLGTRILSRQTGMMARGADDLFAAARRAKVVIRGDQFTKTRAAISKLQAELQTISAYPEVRQALKVLENTKTTLLGNGATLDDVIKARSIIGGAVRRAESAGGVKLGVTKKIFKELNNDLDRFATSPGLIGRQTRLAQAGVARAKLDFSVEELEEGVARFIKDSPDVDGTVFNVQGFQKWFRDITNPKHKAYNKNLSEALKDEIPEIQEKLVELAKIVKPGSAAGPGSIVIRGQTAKVGRSVVGAVMGGGIGFGLGGAAGAAAGGVIGASMPEMVVAALMTKQGRQFLSAATKMGRGEMNTRMWTVLGEILAKQAGVKESEPSSLVGDTKKDTRRQIETIR